MRKLLLAAALVVATTGGTARADVFAVVPTATGQGAPLVLPSAETPNTPGSLLLPPAWTSETPAPTVLGVEQLQQLWQRAGASYAVPWQVLAAINKIESNFGRNMGPSSAGAVGWMQFMPDTWLRWGMDGDGDGTADPWDPEDAVFAAARYLSAAGGATDVRRAVFAYNHADWYVDDVLALAQTFGSGGDAAAFTLDRMQVDLEAAQRAVAAASESLTAARKTERAHARVEARLVHKVATYELLSDRLAAQKRATLAGVAHATASARAAELAQTLRDAESALADARARSQQATFAPAAGTLLGAPAFSGDYVFPVGGGPGVVSVGATHHDYPAADIAAAEGAPLYALANGVVERAWTYPDARCGVGFTIHTADGLYWTYCHLSYLEPSVTPGATLAAGASVGLVGSTGHASGPHLHLQLHPATAYPQQQAWFQSFAGTAFTWQGEAPAPAAPVAPRSSDVFGGAGDGDVVLFSR